jgi:hypothetical protein
MHHPRLTSFTVYRLFLLIALVVATFMGNSALAQVTTSSILGNRGIYLTPPDTTGCGLIKFANGTGPTCTAC